MYFIITILVSLVIDILIRRRIIIIRLF